MDGHETLVAELKADTSVSVEAAAVRILNAEKARKGAQLQTLADESVHVNSTVVDITGDVPKTNESMWAAMNAHQRAEYNDDYDTFAAYTNASEAGLVKVFNQK